MRVDLIRARFLPIISFAVVGVVAFAVDAGVLYLAVGNGLGLDLGRVASYLCAVTVSWELNRRFTFSETATRASFFNWTRFAVAQLGGAAINLGSYFLLVHLSQTVARHPVIGVAVGSLSGMCLNYLTARLYVFRRSGARGELAVERRIRL